MFFTIVVVVVLLLILLLVLRPAPALSTPHLIPASPPPLLQSRHVSFSLVSTNSSYSVPSPKQRRWSSPFPKRNSSTLDHPRLPQPVSVHSAPATPIDHFGRILPPSATAGVHSQPKSSRRLSTSLRLSFTSRRRSSSASCTSTLIHVDSCTLSSPSSTATSLSPLQRTKFVNPFTKQSKSQTPSPPNTLKSLDMSSNPSNISSPSSPPPRRRTLVNKFKSIFTSTPPEPNSSTLRSKPIFSNFDRFRRKPTARTQPYGPPWNAPMPVPEFDLSQHSFQKPTQAMSPLFQNSQKRAAHGRSRPEIKSASPRQISPRTFINELDEKLSLLQQQHART